MIWWTMRCTKCKRELGAYGDVKEDPPKIRTSTVFCPCGESIESATFEKRETPALN